VGDRHPLAGVEEFGDARPEVVRSSGADLDVRRQPEHELARCAAPGAGAGPAGAEVVTEEDDLAGTGEPVPAAAGAGGQLDVDLDFLVGTRQRSLHTASLTICGGRARPAHGSARTIDGAG